MKINLIVFLLMLNCLNVNASEMAEPAGLTAGTPSAEVYVARSAVYVTRSIEQMKAEQITEVAKCDRFLELQQQILEKKCAEITEGHSRDCTLIRERSASLIPAKAQLFGKVNTATEIAKFTAELESISSTHKAKLEEAANVCKRLVSSATDKKETALKQVSALDALVAALEVTPCLDIGGIRNPLCCGMYNLADTSHITLNSDERARPNFLFDDGLNFGKILRTFPELRTILSRRSIPINCLISYVGVNIFGDVLGEKLNKKDSCSFEGMVANYGPLAELLPEFVSGFAEFLSLFKGGCFTYKSFKKGPEKVQHEYFLGDMKSMGTEPIEVYTCWSGGKYIKLAHFSFSQDVREFCPHEGLFSRILTDALDLPATTKIHQVIGEEGQVAIYSQTVVHIPGTFTGAINDGMLKEVSRWFLSKQPTVVSAACVVTTGG